MAASASATGKGGKEERGEARGGNGARKKLIECTDVTDGHRSVEGRHCLAKAPGHHHRIRRGAYDQRHVAGWRLEERPINLRLDLAREAVVLDVAHHAHHPDP